MTISVGTQYTVLFWTTISFTFLALVFNSNDAYKILFKIIAGTCWTIMGLSQFVIGDITNILTLVLATVFVIFGMVFYYATVLDWFTSKSYSSERKMGKF